MEREDPENNSKSNQGEIEEEIELLKGHNVKRNSLIIREKSLDHQNVEKSTLEVKETTCGYWCLRGELLQRFANQTSYVILYGLVGCVFSMSYAYFNATITTIEKRFKIPTKNTGIISVGNDTSQLFGAALLGYFAGRRHRPRWIGIGILTMVTFCLLNATLHLLYGPGEEALALTTEFGAFPNENISIELKTLEASKILCKSERNSSECISAESGNISPQIVLFLAQFVSGIGCALYYTLGVSYMDYNLDKSKTPALWSLSYFLHMLGPSVGYTLASYCLQIYITPKLQPTINNEDPRWLGAWWIGWLVLAVLVFIPGTLLSLFPKSLPKPVKRQKKLVQIEHRGAQIRQEEGSTEKTASLQDMLKTFKRILQNKTLMYNNFSSIFYFFGYTPYWIFTPKYIEIQYRQTASASSFFTGTVALIFTGFGILSSGFVISKFKPSARRLAAWNVFVNFVTVAGILGYAFIGCADIENSLIVNNGHNGTFCNNNCNCEYVAYTPVCGSNNKTYISPCHAGCRTIGNRGDSETVYENCSWISSNNLNDKTISFDFVLDFNSLNSTSHMTPIDNTYNATPGACPVDCFREFVFFLVVMCSLKFFGATGRASNLLITMRCIPVEDKTAAMGFGMTLISLLTFIPSPIFFGWLMDSLCLVWGKTCTNKGNCWLYDAATLRYALNLTAAAFIIVGGLLDCVVWLLVKDLKIFDEEKQTDILLDDISHKNVDVDN
ncbi:solute carrier organic anion transporter family member 74D-like [Teleopsis dalmanni]|uniref:solute carrier organic anion transporter family member 74D-like n=1 Tax=Teleopsis dalmanni TaxID=139649 RepID=UPI0018CE3916|nr:solute carrier organic anion transporter family member 74D-like [Teleopsis dalmanni]